MVRHLPTDMPPGHCYGRLDLSPGRMAEPAPVLAALRSFPAARLVSSPARRCRALAAAIGVARGLPVVLDARLLELDFGAWEGLAWEAVPRPALDEWAADPWGFAPPGGESGAGLVARVRAFHAELQAGTVVVSHGGPLKVLAALLEGRAVDLLAPAQPMGTVRVAGQGGAPR
ncbi:histidine phosphatase family protein [Teichococcus coralli]|nr:histidine phosphatase family protein [Pseudoroseomonas coralli]